MINNDYPNHPGRPGEVGGSVARDIFIAKQTLSQFLDSGPLERYILAKHGWRKTGLDERGMNGAEGYIAPRIKTFAFKKDDKETVIHNNGRTFLENGNYISRGSDEDGYGVYGATNPNARIPGLKENRAKLLINDKRFIGIKRLDLKRETLAKEFPYVKNVSNTILAATLGYDGYKARRTDDTLYEVEYGILNLSNTRLLLDGVNNRINFLYNKFVLSRNFNPWHDKFGRFTWSPFGVYKGDPYKAVSIAGKEYSKLIKDFDTSRFTDEEKAIIESYISSPEIGNSWGKNGFYREVTMFFDKDGNPLDAKELENAAALYKKVRDIWKTPYEERSKLEAQLNEKYMVLKNQKTPAVKFMLLKENLLDKPDILATVGEMKKEASQLIGKKYGGKYLKMDSHELFQIVRNGYVKVNDKRFSDLPEKDKAAFEVLYKLAEAKSKYASKEIKDIWGNNKAKTFNWLKYERESNYIKTTYPNTRETEIGIPLQYLSGLSDKQLKKYMDVYTKFGDADYATVKFRREIKGRQLDKTIQAKGISFDKDIVLSRRISDETVIRQEISRMGFYTQSGFTSTTAGNNIAKKSPGTMVFGDNLIKIIIPAGTKVLPIEKFAREAGEEPSILRQHEVLLPSNTKFLPTTGNKTLSSIDKYFDSFNKWDKSLELDKIDYNNNYVIPMIAITQQYAESQK